MSGHHRLYFIWRFICVPICFLFFSKPWDVAAHVPDPGPVSHQADHEIAGAPSARYRELNEHIDANIALSGGLRFDQLDWSIAGNADGTNPNVISELKWKKVESYQLTISGNLQINRHFYGRGQASVAWIQSGEVRDSDYDGDNRTLEYSRSISETNGDELYDLTAGIGYPFHLQGGRLFLAPLMGMSLHYQNFRITDGYQVISEKPGTTPPVGPLDERLDSTYCTRWLGLWIGGDLRYQMAPMSVNAPPIELALSLAYHFWGDYSAEADWNLRSDLKHPKSFDHEADGRGGYDVTARCHIPINALVSLTLAGSYARWTTDEGKTTFYRTDGSTRVQQLNKVTWESHSVAVGIACRFF